MLVLNYCWQIQGLSRCEIDTHVLIADVMLRRNKFVRAMRSLVVGKHEFSISMVLVW